MDILQLNSAVTRAGFELPDWLIDEEFVTRGPFPTREQRMALAIELSRRNVDEQTGGPFGAIIVHDSTGELVSVGVNLVTRAGLSVAHAEMVAFSLAQRRIGHWNLKTAGPLQLVTSCEPCAMCYGAIPWSGVSSVICGASKDHAEAVGFDEGDKPEKWRSALIARGIAVETGVLCEEAGAVFSYYQQSDGEIYNSD